MKCLEKKKKRGISLIVLVITIGVIIIIAGAVILTVNHNNPVDNAKQAAWKEDIRGMQESISLYIAKFSKDQMDPDVSKYMNITQTTQLNGKNAFQEIFGNSFKKYFAKVAIVNGSLHLIGSHLTAEEVTWAKELNINIIFKNNEIKIITNKKHQMKLPFDVFIYIYISLLVYIMCYEKIAKIASKRCIVLSFLLYITGILELLLKLKIE